MYAVVVVVVVVVSYYYYYYYYYHYHHIKIAFMNGINLLWCLSTDILLFLNVVSALYEDPYENHLLYTRTLMKITLVIRLSS